MERTSSVESPKEPLSHRAVELVIYTLALGWAAWTAHLIISDDPKFGALSIVALIITCCVIDIRRDVKKIKEKAGIP